MCVKTKQLTPISGLGNFHRQLRKTPSSSMYFMWEVSSTLLPFLAVLRRGAVLPSCHLEQTPAPDSCRVFIITFLTTVYKGSLRCNYLHRYSIQEKSQHCRIPAASASMARLHPSCNRMAQVQRVHIVKYSTIITTDKYTVGRNKVQNPQKRTLHTVHTKRLV